MVMQLEAEKKKLMEELNQAIDEAEGKRNINGTISMYLDKMDEIDDKIRTIKKIMDSSK